MKRSSPIQPGPLTRRAFVAAGAALAWPLRAQGFDHSHAPWTALLKKHLLVVGGGKASKVRYAALANDRAALKACLAGYSAVGVAMFASFSKPQQMAFLMNAYNAFTVELILTRYPKLVSIKDLGSVFESPWKQKFVPLLGNTLSLDGIEHDMLRSRGRFDDPRVHFAVNCASIGCPPLREEAFVAERLDAQLDEQLQRFLSDRSRNRWSAANQRLEVSKIFDWYGEDFQLGHKGINSATALYARYAEQLADAPADRERIRSQSASVAYLDYDWKLNDAA
ncbi:MAG: DUF547 domain-containing protein [Burkholderiales bacterium]|nr:DUF547 domain-containing protein [Burkholderiales bacterium]